VLHVSQVSDNNIPTLFLLQFIFKNSASILRKLYFLNRYKFLTVALSLLLNGTLHHWYIIVSVLNIIIYDNIICFCLQTSEMYVKLNNLILYENQRKLFQKMIFCICITLIFSRF